MKKGGKEKKQRERDRQLAFFSGNYNYGLRHL